MPLRLRRGINADRAGIVFEEGELVYTTDTKQVYIGDGTTPGGINLITNASSVAPNSITVNELQPTSWTADQVLAIDGSGVLYFKDDTIGTVGANTIGITELNVTDGTNGQVLSTDGSGNLSFITAIPDSSITSVKIQDQAIIASKLSATGGTDGQVLSINAGGGLEWINQSAASVGENSVGVTELNVTAGSDGQALAIDGLGNLQFIDVLTEIVDGAITPAKLSATIGTTNQVLTLNGALGLEWVDASTVTSVAANSVGITELNVTDGTNGQVLSTDGSGNLSFITINTIIADGSITTAKIQDQAIIASKLSATGGTDGQVLSINAGGGLEWVDASTVATVPDGSITPPKLSATAATAGQFLSVNIGGGFEWRDVLTSVLSSDVDLNNNNITGNGNININGTLTGVDLDVGGSVNSFLIPGSDSVYDLGLITNRWRGGYFAGLTVDGHIDTVSIAGDLLGIDSTVAFNAATGAFNGNFIGSLFADDSTLIVDAIRGKIDGSVIEGLVRADFVGTLFGDVTGDIQGSVFAKDSSVMVDADGGLIRADVFNTVTHSEQLFVTSSLGSPILVNATTAGGTNGPNLSYNTVRGTIASPLALQGGDTVVDIAASGFDGTNNETPTAVIKMGVDSGATVSNGIMPGRILFFTYDSSGTTGTNNVMVFNSQGNLGIKTGTPSEALDVAGNIKSSGSIQPGVYADATARDAAITSPVEGMMVFLQDIQKFVGYVSDTGLAGGGASNATPGWVNIN